MGLRAGQKELVEEYVGGKCAVAAIPGGGKTHCLSIWVAKAIADGITGDGKVLVVTYMNSAVNNFKQRITAELKKKNIVARSKYDVSTIHSLCMQIIKEKPDTMRADEDFIILEGKKKDLLLGSAIEEWKKDNLDVFFGFLERPNESKDKQKWSKEFQNAVTSIISDVKGRKLNPVDMKRLVQDRENNGFLMCIADIYDIYDRKLKSLGSIDFDDMLINALTALETDSHLLEKYRKKYAFVCEDEAQDSNYIQTRILTLIADGNLLRVGDSNQAICGTFTSSDFNLFKSFCSDEDTKKYDIYMSSRSSVDIIDMANSFVKYVTKEHPVRECRDSLLPQYISPVENEIPGNPKTLDDGIDIEALATPDAEADWVAEKIIKRLVSNSDETIAVLVPFAWMMGSFKSVFDRRGIKYESLDNASAERNKTLRELGYIISFIANTGSKVDFANMITNVFIEPEEIDFTKEVKEEEKLPVELLREYLLKTDVEKILYPVTGQIDREDLDDELVKLPIWKEFLNSIKTVLDIIQFPTIITEKLILYIAERLGYNSEETAIAQKVATDIPILFGPVNNWSLSDLASELLAERQNQFSYFANIVWELKGYDPKPGVVTISTYHKAKGLEWDTVFLTALETKTFPSYPKECFGWDYPYLKAQIGDPTIYVKNQLNKITGVVEEDKDDKIENISEKIRLLYVGITRAKKSLYISAVTKWPRKPSLYFEFLKEYIKENR